MSTPVPERVECSANGVILAAARFEEDPAFRWGCAKPFCLIPQWACLSIVSGGHAAKVSRLSVQIVSTCLPPVGTSTLEN